MGEQGGVARARTGLSMHIGNKLAVKESVLLHAKRTLRLLLSLSLPFATRSFYARFSPLCLYLSLSR